VAVALEQSGRGKRAAAGQNVALEIVERHIGVGQPRGDRRDLLAEVAEQVERDAGGGETDEVGLSRADVGEAERAEPGLGVRGRVENGT
jgi:hypothetical protein